MSVTSDQPASATEALSYQDLYRRWEEGNWLATEIDFSVDRDGWRGLSDIQRRSALWLYSMFLYGEDSVTHNLGPYIDAAPTEEQKYFLATQQVDEARHAVFFHRFFVEVMGSSGGIGEVLAQTSAHQNWGYRAVFERLDRMSDELRRDRSLPRFAQAIALYHLVVEATLAQPGQHFIEDHFAKVGSLPGFSEGMRNVARDEQRHIGFGVKTLAELFRASQECKAAVVELLSEVMRYALSVFIPPGWDRRYTREYGFELEDIYAYGIRSVRAKWRATGYPLEEMPGIVFPFDPTLPEEQIAGRVLALLEGGVLGEPDARPSSSPEVQRHVFAIIERGLRRERAGHRPLTIQWNFTDAAPWYLRFENGATRAEQGRAPDADVTLESSWREWIDVALRGRSPLLAFALRELRLHGSPRGLARLALIAPPRPKLRAA
jgi:ribonucleotide reductase beta subunit family protein with ferritin-like domain